MTFVLLTAGIDLSVGSNMYLSAMAAGYLLQNPGAAQRLGRRRWPSSPGSRPERVFGAVNAFCVVVLRITPFLVTLATLVAGRGLGTAITESFGIEFPPAYLAFGASRLLGVPMPIVVFAIVVSPRTSCSAGPSSAGRSTPSATTRRRRARPASPSTASSSRSM